MVPMAPSKTKIRFCTSSSMRVMALWVHLGMVTYTESAEEKWRAGVQEIPSLISPSTLRELGRK
ncbi:hypothetical protein GCM10023183_32980 [Nibribacter koreensis]|uniref:Uncharacterized protein n=1 Tax=Nibribacter koreensis TaxID=1084519 RepID=A0ABP8FYB8_9BACT